MTDAETVMLSDYDEIAEEYYDAKRHPTCANFRDLSKAWIKRLLEAAERRYDSCLEVGAGRSILAELKKEGLTQIGRLAISDKSSKMLEHSRDLAAFCNTHFVLDAEAPSRLLPEHVNSYDLIVCSLADPYNSEALWHSLRYLVKRNGTILFTTPSLDWAESFRLQYQEGLLEVASFAMRREQNVVVRSTILSPQKQIELCRKAGFVVNQWDQLYADKIEQDELSWKLAKARSGSVPVVTAYSFSPFG